MHKRTLTSGTNTLVAVLIMLGILVLVNFLGYRHFVRADLTEAKEYTLSDATKDLCRRMDDLVNVRAYFSSDLPPQLAAMTGQIRDLLSEYQAYSGGNIRVEYIDPGSDAETEQKLARMGIMKARLDVIERDKREVADIYLGIAVQYGDRQESIPVVKNLYNLEYDLTNALLKTTRSEDPVVGYITGHGERELDVLNVLKMSLEEQYQFRPLDLAVRAEIPADIDTVILAGPGDVPEEHKYALDQFIMRGGKALFLMDPVELQSETMGAMPKPNTLGDLLTHYGFEISPKLVCDGQSNARAMFNQGYLRYSLPYPYWPRVRTGHFEPTAPAVSMLEALVLPWTGEVNLREDRMGEERSGTVLATTTDLGWVVGAPFNLNPRTITPPPQEDLGRRNLVATVRGQFDSFYAGKPVPGPEGEEPVEPDRPTMEKSVETRLVVVPCSSFVEDQFLQLFPFNRTFLLNVVDWLTTGDELIQIRSRQVTERPLEEITESRKALIKYANTFGISILVVILGLVRTIMRRREKRLFEEGYRS